VAEAEAVFVPVARLCCAGEVSGSVNTAVSVNGNKHNTRNLFFMDKS
jgi:hypothetical protein